MKQPAWLSPDAAQVNGVWSIGAVNEHIASIYHQVRAKEKRLLGDAVVRDLPQSGALTDHAREWRIRARAMRRLLRVLAKAKKPLRVLDVGCGNGWLAARISEAGHEVAAIDIHRTELEQAARVFHDRSITWLNDDPFVALLPQQHFDLILFAASIQYFGDLSAILDRCAEWLAPHGEVRIIDSRFYPDAASASAAARRTVTYYETLGVPEMAQYYHHHMVTDLFVHPGLMVTGREAAFPLERLFGTATFKCFSLMHRVHH